MGLWSWLFPSPEQKLDAAREALAAGRFNDARLAAQALDLPGARAIVEEAEEGLMRLNLAHAVSWGEAGDAGRVQHHMELAARFARPDHAWELRDAERRIRELDQARQAEARARAAQDERRWMDVDPRFFDAHGEGELPLPPGVSEEEAEAVRMRVALLYENYPEDLRPGVLRLGPDFVGAVLELDEGRAAEALAALVALPDDEPLVQHERARAALALGDPAAAAGAWERFGRLVGHRELGAQHTAALLAHALVQSGQHDAALAALAEARKTDPMVGAGLYAALLESRGSYGEAEGVLRELIRKVGAQAPAYGALARVRVKAGDRMGAMTALETAMRVCGCGTGKCGTIPADVSMVRLLAILYLEDGIERPRALELAEQARAMVSGEPGWEDLYLATLAAREDHDPAWSEMAAALRRVTAPDDPRAARLTRYLPEPPLGVAAG